MTINFELTGKERKTLVETISRELNITAKYLGMPTAAFQIGEYNVSKNGVLTGADNRGLIAALSGVHGFNAITEEYDCETQTAPEEANAGDTAPETATTASEAEQERAFKFDTPRGSFKIQAVYKTAGEAEAAGYGIYFTHNAHDVYSKPSGTGEHCKLFALVGEPFEAGENAGQITEIAPETASDTVNIEYPLNGFTPEKLDNLMKMVTAKAPLIKAALGTDALPIQQTDNALIFPWMKGDIDSEQLNACTSFIAQLCKTALTKKRVTAKKKDVPENPKFAFRVFLLSLGFIGNEFKTIRKVLLSRLEGNSAWRDGKKAITIETSTPSDNDIVTTDDRDEIQINTEAQ